MAQGEFSETVKAVDEMFKAIPKSKSLQYIGHLNDILLFLNAAEKTAPYYVTPPVETKTEGQK